VAGKKSSSSSSRIHRSSNSMWLTRRQQLQQQQGKLMVDNRSSSSTSSNNIGPQVQAMLPAWRCCPAMVLRWGPSPKCCTSNTRVPQHGLLAAAEATAVDAAAHCWAVLEIWVCVFSVHNRCEGTVDSTSCSSRCVLRCCASVLHTSWCVARDFFCLHACTAVLGQARVM